VSGVPTNMTAKADKKLMIIATSGETQSSNTKKMLSGITAHKNMCMSVGDLFLMIWFWCATIPHAQRQFFSSIAV
jgi:hypothetical protein